MAKCGMKRRGLYLLDGLRTSRKPRLIAPHDGIFLIRDADRQLVAPMFQLPPRETRLEPVAGPVGSFSGESE